MKKFTVIKSKASGELKALWTAPKWSSYKNKKSKTFKGITKIKNVKSMISGKGKATSKAIANRGF
jgi:hypothetical protein